MSELLQSVKENGIFLLTCLAIAAGLVIAALLAQKFLCKDYKNVSPSRRVAFTAIFSAAAAVLMLFDIPLFFAPSFYQLDLSEIPVLLCSFYLGPVAGVVSELLKNIIKLLIKGTTTAFVGDFANFCVGCSFILPASILYHIHRTKKNAILGMALGTLVLTVFGSAFNAVYLLPKFAELYGISIEALIGMGAEVNAHITSISTLVLFAVVPFNILKGVVVSLVTFLLYKRLERLFFRNA